MKNKMLLKDFLNSISNIIAINRTMIGFIHEKALENADYLKDKNNLLSKSNYYFTENLGIYLSNCKNKLDFIMCIANHNLSLKKVIIEKRQENNKNYYLRKYIITKKLMKELSVHFEK